MPDVRINPGFLLDDVAGVIDGAIVDDQNLVLVARQCLVRNAIDGRSQEISTVQRRNDDTKLQRAPS